MIGVGVNGYGTIGRRVADAVDRQSDMELVGVTKTKPDYKSEIAAKKGVPIYGVDEKSVSAFGEEGYSVRGTLQDLLRHVDLIVDTTPKETGATYFGLYGAAGIRSVFQGGEKHSLTGLSFVAQCNFEEAVGKQNVRVVSCNTTGLCRGLHALDTSFGVERAEAILARRAADPDDASRGPIDAAVTDSVPSHQGEDVKTVMRGMNIVSMAFTVPTTHMHLHSLIVDLKRPATKELVIEAFEKEPRVMVVGGRSGIRSTAQLMDLGRELGRPRNDIYEAVVLENFVSVNGSRARFFLGIHQEAIVVPENIDAIRALSGQHTKAESMGLTDSALGIARK